MLFSAKLAKFENISIGDVSFSPKQNEAKDSKAAVTNLMVFLVQTMARSGNLKLWLSLSFGTFESHDGLPFAGRRNVCI